MQLSPAVSLFFLAVALLDPGPANAGTSVSQLEANPVAIERAVPVVSNATQRLLSVSTNRSIKVWVFFTDKGVFDHAGYQQRAATVSLGDRSLRRRAKVGKDRVLFVDLPVVEQYVHQIESLGGTLRRRSRYLNAASFELPVNAVNAVASLSFVSKVTPVAIFERPPDPVVTERAAQLSEAAAPPVNLNYGSSYTQLSKINVPAVHQKGYNGQGVVVAIFDTGFRKTHEVFANAYTENRVLAEHDFVFNDGNTANESADVSSQWNHGTSTWSLVGGLLDGKLYGGAYEATFILAKTEDLRSESHVEEDNWVSALEWADSLGVDVVSSSVSYLGFSDGSSYAYSDLDGQTAVITLAADMADSLGIVVCNSMGNDGPASGSLHVPADAFGILAVGSVSASGIISSSSSRGPTYDGRIKPEICAMGVNTYAAAANSNTSYNSAFSGTSASTPVAAGAVCLLIQARPTFPPELIRQAIMETASLAATPDNSYGWGIMNIDSAVSWGAGFRADTTGGSVPLTVHFTNLSQLPGDSLFWDFGDGVTSRDSSPTHQFTTTGHFTVTLTNYTSYGPLTAQKTGYISVLSDTIRFESDSVLAGGKLVLPVYLSNAAPLESLIVPVKIAMSPLHITIDSITFGSRTASFDCISFPLFDQTGNRFVVRLVSDTGSGKSPLAAGSGEILRLYASVSKYDLGGQTNSVDTAVVDTNHLRLDAASFSYTPAVLPGQIATKPVLRGDFNRSFVIDAVDLAAMIMYLVAHGDPPVTVQCADLNADLTIELLDLSRLVSYLITGSPKPPNP